MYGAAPDLDGDAWVELSDGLLERFEARVFIRKNAKLGVGRVVGDAEAYTAGDVLFVGAEPGVALGLAEDVVQKGVVSEPLGD